MIIGTADSTMKDDKDRCSTNAHWFPKEKLCVEDIKRGTIS